MSPEARRGKDSPTSFCQLLVLGLLASRTVRECIPGFLNNLFVVVVFYVFIGSTMRHAGS